MTSSGAGSATTVSLTRQRWASSLAMDMRCCCFRFLTRHSSRGGGSNNEEEPEEEEDEAEEVWIRNLRQFNFAIYVKWNHRNNLSYLVT